METFRPGDRVVAIHTDLSAPIYAPRPQNLVFEFPDGPLQRRVIYHVEQVLPLNDGAVGLYIAGLRVICDSQEITWHGSRFRKVQPVQKSRKSKSKRTTLISCPS